MTRSNYIPSVNARNKIRKTYNIGKRTKKPIYEPDNMNHYLNDAFRQALPPGWRKSANGNWYYEARINRADNESNNGYLIYVNPKTGKEHKIKDTKANREKLLKLFNQSKRTRNKKQKTVKTNSKKTTQPPIKKQPLVKNTKKRPKTARIGRSSAKAKAKVRSINRTAKNRQKMPFELMSLYKGNRGWYGYIKLLTGSKKGFSIYGTLKTFKFRVDSNTIDDYGFTIIMNNLVDEKLARKATGEEKKTAIRHLAANGWTKYDSQKSYLEKITRDMRKAESKKENAAKKRAENKAKREERQKKALEYVIPNKPTPTDVDTRPTVNIDEQRARWAKEARSFSDYKSGSATNSYRSYIESAAEKVNAHKAKVDPIHWPEIDSKFELYKKRIGEWINEQNRIEASMPAWFIAGPSKYNVKKWNKVQSRESAHYKEYEDKVEGLLRRILSIGSSGAISSDDKQAVQKIESKLAKLERDQELMKMANAYYRKHGTLDGADLPADILAEGKENIENAKKWYGGNIDIEKDRKTYISWTTPFGGAHLTNNSANIRRLKDRNEQLKKQQAAPSKPDVDYLWGTVVRNKEENRLQLLFNSIPSPEVRDTLKSHGFRWSPKNKAWQRQLTGNAEYDFKNFVLPKLKI